MKKRSIIMSALRATGRFTRGVVAVGTVGVSELAIAGVKKVGSIFKEKKSDDEDFDFEDFEEDFEEVLEDAIETMDFKEVEEEPTPTAEQMAEVAENWEAKAEKVEPTQAPQTPVQQTEADPQ